MVIIMIHSHDTHIMVIIMIHSHGTHIMIIMIITIHSHDAHITIIIIHTTGFIMMHTIILAMTLLIMIQRGYCILYTRSITICSFCRKQFPVCAYLLI